VGALSPFFSEAANLHPFRAKYGLAIVEYLLENLGKDLGLGYDVGCKFGTTVAQSELGALAAELNFRSLVGLFHGHAHNRLCQLAHLGTYLKGMGIEDLEGLERLFSRTNALASTTRHASSFHRKQAFSTYLEHLDLTDTYENLSKFICDNYRQALKILDEASTLTIALEHLGVTDGAIVETWLQEEKAYLLALKQEPSEETDTMEYYDRLLKLEAAK
jgi:hypothetical protein